MGRISVLVVVFVAGCAVEAGEPCEADSSAPYAAYGTFACHNGDFLKCERGAWITQPPVWSNAPAVSPSDTGEPSYATLSCTCNADKPDQYECTPVDF